MRKFVSTNYYFITHSRLLPKSARLRKHFEPRVGVGADKKGLALQHCSEYLIYLELLVLVVECGVVDDILGVADHVGNLLRLLLSQQLRL